jgi:hypothetical protein
LTGDGIAVLDHFQPEGIDVFEYLPRERLKMALVAQSDI